MKSFKHLKIQHDILRVLNILHEKEKINHLNTKNPKTKLFGYTAKELSRVLRIDYDVIIGNVIDLLVRKLIEPMTLDGLEHSKFRIADEDGIIELKTNALLNKYKTDKINHKNLRASVRASKSVRLTNRIQRRSIWFNGILALITAIVLILQTCILRNQSQMQKQTQPQTQTPEKQPTIPQFRQRQH